MKVRFSRPINLPIGDGEPLMIWRDGEILFGERQQDLLELRKNGRVVAVAPHLEPNRVHRFVGQGRFVAVVGTNKVLDFLAARWGEIPGTLLGVSNSGGCGLVRNHQGYSLFSFASEATRAFPATIPVSTTFAISDDASLYVVSGVDAVQVWDLQTGLIRHSIDDRLLALLQRRCVSALHNLVIAGDAKSGIIKAWTLSSGQQIWSLCGKFEPRRLQLSDDGKIAGLIGWNEGVVVQLRNAATGELLIDSKGHDFALGPAGMAATITADGTLQKLCAPYGAAEIIDTADTVPLYSRSTAVGFCQQEIHSIRPKGYSITRVEVPSGYVGKPNVEDDDRWATPHGAIRWDEEHQTYSDNEVALTFERPGQADAVFNFSGISLVGVDPNGERVLFFDQSSIVLWGPCGRLAQLKMPCSQLQWSEDHRVIVALSNDRKTLSWIDL